MRKVLAVLTSAVTALVFGGATAAAGTSELPPGPDTTTPYLSGRTLHLGPTVLTVPDSVGDANSRFELVGQSARGWVLSVVETVGEEPATSVVSELYVLASTGATRFYRHTYGRDVGTVDFRLSDSRRRVLAWASTSREATFEGAYTAVIDLNGTILRHRTIRHRTWPLDFSGKRVVYSETYGATRLWRLGHKPRVIIDRPARFASFEQNRLTVKSTHKRWRFVPLSRPHHQLWRARFDGVSISPNGRRVVGFSTSRPGRPIEVRRTHDGHLLTTWAVPPLNYDRPGLVWETDAAVTGDAILDLDVGIWTVMRCRVGSTCERASGDLSAPIQFASNSS